MRRLSLLIRIVIDYAKMKVRHKYYNQKKMKKHYEEEMDYGRSGIQ